MKKYTVEVAFYGKDCFEGIEAETEEEAIAKVWELINSGKEPDFVDDQQYGYPCHTGWPDAEASEE